jgi:CheY-like chemotaxis protein
MIQKSREKRPSAKLLRIAVLDDEPLIRDLLHESLTGMGHKVICFARPCEALEATRSLVFDVILSDIKMRGMSGIEFYERLRAANPVQAARVMFITGDIMSPGTQAFLGRVNCLYLIKPFRQADLIAKIEEMLQDCQCSNESVSISKAA